MNAMEDGPMINNLVTRLAELEQKLVALQAERAPADGQTHVHKVETSASPEKVLGRKRESRRRILGKGLGVAAATLGAAALLEVSTGTALANGFESSTYFLNNGSNTIPVYAYSTSAADGLIGISTGGNGVVGEGIPVSSFGVLGVGYGNLTSSGAAVAGLAISTTDTEAVGVYGDGKSGFGVYGTAQGSSGTGVLGTSNNSDGTGVIGSGDTGVMGVSSSTTGGAAVFGAGQEAGLFSGNVDISGFLTKGGGSFKIDHPLDPANKYLSHSFVESPDMKNVYDGVVTLDVLGGATVTLPAWFGTLNKDFRYQLTSIGTPGPNLYIAAEISNNSFKIAGGTVGMKVSWQVTGIRQDAFALARPVVVEQNKSAKERGRYLHPTLHGHTASESVVTIPNAAKLKPVAPAKVPIIPIPKLK